MRLATWNVNSVGARLPRLLEWLQTREPDVACLQETKCADNAFPVEEVRALGYDVAAHGDGRWNGVALVSRVGLEDVRRDFDGVPPFGEPALVEARAVSATCGDLRVWSVYVPNGRTPDSSHYAYKLDWLDALRDAVQAELAGHPSTVVCGDFNVAPTDGDVWDPAVFTESTHVTPPERERVAALRDLGLHDVVPRPGKGPNPFTYWDYRAGMFHKDMGMRIDHVYASVPVADRIDDAWVDRETRKGKGPSDHAPVMVDLTDA
ncbi:MAG: exodeoxyribonuclease III [Actinomycetes bacterium]